MGLLQSNLNVPHAGAAFDWFITHPFSASHVQHTAPLEGIDHPEWHHQKDEN